jgi:hypothetical protein
MTDDDWLDIYDPDPDAEPIYDAAEKFLHEHREAANDNPPAHPAYFELWDSYHFTTAQEVFDLQQRAWKQVEDDLHHARREATDQR